MNLEREVARCRFKLGLCLRNARENSRNSWQHAENARQRREWRVMARESIEDARYWLRNLNELRA